jgi:hypothetical protein
MTIPKTLHQAWCGPKPIPDRERRWCEEMAKMNPGWKCILHTNEILHTYRDDPYVRTLIDTGESWAFVLDRIRVLLLKEHGGVWLDADCQPVHPLDSLTFWKDERIQFVAGMRSPHRRDVALHRAVPMVDNTFLASVPNGAMIRRLDSLWSPSAPLVNGHRIGVAIMESIDHTTVLLNHRYVYAEQQYPETLVMHDQHNLGSWVSKSKLQHA